MLGVVPYCDECGIPMVPTYKDQQEEIITLLAKVNGWQISKDKKRGNDLCPSCQQKLNKSK